MNNQDKVREFMKLAGQDTPEQIEIPNENVRKLRVKLFLEEVLEFAKASGVEVFSDSGKNLESTDDFSFMALNEESVDLVEVADACSDIEYVLHGASVAYGFNSQPIFDLVHISNMAKFGSGGYKREDGKWIKPPDWQPPDIKSEIARQNMANVFKLLKKAGDSAAKATENLTEAINNIK